jgi:DNA-binding NarL/FixJ family response regulator
MIRIAITAEHEIARWALREALSNVIDMTVVGDAGTVEDAIAAVTRLKPDVLLLDVALPDHTGYDVLKEIRELDASPHVVMLGIHDEPSYAVRAIEAGAHAFVLKSAKPEVLLAAIRAVVRGERVVPPGVEPLLELGDGHPAAALSKREQEVMEMLARGMTNREIAHQLAIKLKTVDSHRGHILTKLQLRNNAELTRFAVKHGYVTV